MWIGILYHVILSALFGLFVFAAIQNVRSFSVPNILYFLILILYAILVLTAPFTVNWLVSVLISLVVLALGYPFFSLRIFTATDVKLMSLLSLWAGPSLLAELLFITFATGAILAAITFSNEGFKQSLEGTGFARGLKFALRSNTQVPFGFAIALGALGILLSYEQIINLSL